MINVNKDGRNSTMYKTIQIDVLWLVDISMWTPAPQSPSSPTSTVSLRVLPSLSTQDMKTAGQWQLQYSDDVALTVFLNTNWLLF